MVRMEINTKQISIRDLRIDLLYNFTIIRPRDDKGLGLK